MKSSELTPLLFTVYLAAASGRSPALPCFAAFLALVRFSRLFAFTQLFFQTPMSKDGFFRPYEYIYDEYFNFVLCSENHVLSYSTTNRDGCREFKSKPYICENCPFRGKCTANSSCIKTVLKHLWNGYLELAEDYRHTPEIRKLYDRRKETIERVFADTKEKHSMRFTYFRGLARITNWVRLKFAAMNLKKYVLHRWLYCFLLRFLSFFRLSVYSLLIIQKAIFLFLRKMVFRQTVLGLLKNRPSIFVYRKPPAMPGVQKSFSDEQKKFLQLV